MTAEQKTAIKEMRENGMSYMFIAQSLSLTKSQISAYCRRNHIEVGEKTQTSKDFCLDCKKPLTQIQGRKAMKFCSPACRQHWWNTHQNAVHRKAYYNFKCNHCGKEFTAYGNSKRKYCSHSCYISERFGHGTGAV